MLLREFFANHTMAGDSHEYIQKALVSFVIERILLDMGKLALDEVGRRLYEKYQCYFTDCLEHPHYLKEVLQEIFGDSSKSVTDQIQKRLVELEEQKPIANFLNVISK
jgi:ribosomal protein S17E